jgi:hypothetical protein
MRFSILFIAILSFFQLCDSTFSESQDDMLIQCRVNIKTLQKKREKHICEKENFDDDFDYQIANMEAPYSGELNRKHLSTSYKVLFNIHRTKVHVYIIRQSTRSKTQI